MSIISNDLKQNQYSLYCNRNIIFKKYNKKISELVRLDINIDILPEEKNFRYNELVIDKTYYIDMSDTDFEIYNEDLKKCGTYDYNNEKLIIFKLPLKIKIPTINNESYFLSFFNLVLSFFYSFYSLLILKARISLEKAKFTIDLQKQKIYDKKNTNIKLTKNNNSISGIKAEERLEKQNKRYTTKKSSRNIKNTEFPNIVLLKDLT